MTAAFGISLANLRHAEAFVRLNLNQKLICEPTPLKPALAPCKQPPNILHPSNISRETAQTARGSEPIPTDTTLHY